MFIRKSVRQATRLYRFLLRLHVLTGLICREPDALKSDSLGILHAPTRVVPPRTGFVQVDRRLKLGQHRQSTRVSPPESSHTEVRVSRVRRRLGERRDYSQCHPPLVQCRTIRSRARVRPMAHTGQAAASAAPHPVVVLGRRQTPGRALPAVGARSNATKRTRVPTACAPKSTASSLDLDARRERAESHPMPSCWRDCAAWRASSPV